MLTLIFNDNSTISITLNGNPVSEYIEKTFKHLQHLPLQFQIFDYLKYHCNNNKIFYDKLLESAKELNIEIDVLQLQDQKYLNSLHKIYELGYNKGSSRWLEFHEMIHAIEAVTNADIHPIPNEMVINFRDRAGPLEKSFDRDFLKYGTQSITKGTCYCRWNELGKIPSQYWLDNEPDDVQRLCQLAKPWTVLRPSINIALEDINFTMSIEQQEKFNVWFSKHKQQWMDYWKLTTWTSDEMSSVIPIGTVENILLLTNNMESGLVPSKIKVQ
jgi:hypothetical protein